MHLLRKIDPQIVYIFIFNLLMVDIVKCNLFFKREFPLNYIVCQGYEYSLVNLHYNFKVFCFDVILLIYDILLNPFIKSRDF